MRHGRGFPGQVIIKRTNRMYFLLPIFGETMIGTDSTVKSTSRLFTEGAIGTDTVGAVQAHTVTLSEGMIGNDHILLNGTDVVWSHMARNSATWTPIQRD